MIKRVQRVGHIKSAADLFLGRARELTVQTTDNAVRVHDGATVGGIELARKDVANVPAATGAVDGKMTASQAGDLSTVKADFTAHDNSTNGHPVATPSVDGFESAADKTKLDGIEALATIDQTPAEILADLLTVDGVSSGLDADLLRGENVTPDSTINTVVRRDGAGRSAFADPSAADDAATKGYTDAADDIGALSAASALTGAELVAVDQTTRKRTTTQLIANLAPSGPIESGTVMLFFQAAVPTGWTQVTSQNNKAFRVVSGTGGGAAGATGFTSVFGAAKVVGGTAITEAQMPAHTHTTPQGQSGSGSFDIGSGGAKALSSGSGTTGGDATHNHTLSLDLQYLDIVMGSLDA